MITNKSVKDLIRSSMNLDDNEQLNESLVAQVKLFDLPTEFLGKANKLNHKELYEGYIKAFNEVSAELDTVDKSASNSNHSSYRSLKNDETYNMNALYLHELLKAFVLQIRN